MTTPWTNFTSDDYGSGVRLTSEFMKNLANNDIAACDRAFQLEFDTEAGSNPIYPTFATVYQRYIIVPPWAKMLRLYFDATLLTGSGTMHVRSKIGGLTSDEFVDSSGVGVLVHPLLTFSDISALRASNSLLELQLATTGLSYANLQSHRMLTNRFSID